MTFAKPLIANHGSNQLEELGNGVNLYGGTPIGGIIMWSGNAATPPDGFILCDGSAISRSNFSTLFSIIGIHYGNGNGSTTFNIPNLVDKFVVGAQETDGASSYPGISRGITGGSSTTTLATANLPSHDHTFSGSASHTHSHTKATHPSGSGPEQNQTGGPEDRTNFGDTGTTGSATVTISGTTGTKGSGTAFENKPPYIALAYMIRTR